MKACVFCLLYACIFMVCFCRLGAAELPKWIASTDSKNDHYGLSQRMNFDESVVSGRMKVAADFARVSVKINDSIALKVEPYCQLQSLDVTQWLKVGENSISLEVDCVEGPSAIAVEFEVRLKSGKVIQLVSDEAWVVAGGSSKVQALGSVRAELWGAGRRDASLSPIENYEQWQQAKGSETEKVQPKFWTAPGFQISLMRTAKADESSWISLAFDDQGRAVVSREDEGLLRMTFDAERTNVEKVEAIKIDLKECRGLVFNGKDLYASANNSKAIFRVQLSDDAKMKSMLRLREFPGGVGHGRNDVTIHNGWLYSIHGDSVELPRDNVTDLTSPIRHWAGDPRGEGYVVGMQLNPTKWEVICGGLRNPYGITAHPSGELFTFDADNEYDMGTPWYRPTRVVALLQGGDVGYRTAGNKMPPRFHDQPENVPPVLTIGRSSPTAVFCDKKLAFPKPYRDAMYLLDWTYGRALAVHLVPRGAGWRAQAELFLQGRPLNVTDVARGDDGSMYVITGGRKTQSSLYRIVAAEDGNARAVVNGTAAQNGAFDANARPGATFAEQKATMVDSSISERDEAHERSAAEFSAKQIEFRKQLELIARNRDNRGTQQVLSHLADADPVLRHAARIALERLPLREWRSLLSKLEDDKQWLYVALVMAQAMDSAEASKMIERWLKCQPTKFDLSSRLVWVRLCEWCLTSNKEAVNSKSSEVITKLLENWPEANVQHVATETSAVELRHRLAQLLGRLKSEKAIEIIARDLLASTLQEDQVAGLLALRQQRSGWTESQRRLQFELLQGADRMVGGEGLPKFMAEIRNESLATLSNTEKELLEPVLNPKTEVATVTGPPRSHVQKWNIDELTEMTSSSLVEGDREQGAKIFREAMCARCHRFGREGKAVGPDLTFVGRRFSPRDLLESILTPSRSVAENFQMDSIATQSGEVYTGRILIEGDYRSQKVRIQTDPLKSDSVVEIAKSEIEEHKQLVRSPMPDGLMDVFSREEIRDLVAYLQNPN